MRRFIRFLKAFQLHTVLFPKSVTITINVEIQPFQLPLEVTTIRLYASSDLEYALCPHCNYPISREYANYCELCGQHLAWNQYEKGTLMIETVDLGGRKTYRKAKTGEDISQRI